MKSAFKEDFLFSKRKGTLKWGKKKKNKQKQKNNVPIRGKCLSIVKERRKKKRISLEGTDGNGPVQAQAPQRETPSNTGEKRGKTPVGMEKKDFCGGFLGWWFCGIAKTHSQKGQRKHSRGITVVQEKKKAGTSAQGKRPAGTQA